MVLASEVSNEEEDLIRTGRAAQLLGIHRETLYRWIRRGLISAIRLPSGEIRIDRAEVDRIILHGRLTVKKPKARKISDQVKPF